MKKRLNILRKIFLFLVKKLFMLPGFVIESFSFCFLAIITPYKGYSAVSAITSQHDLLSWQTVPPLLFLSSLTDIAIAFLSLGGLTVLILILLLIGGDTTLEQKATKMQNSKIVTAFFFGGPTYFILKFSRSGT